MSPKQNRKTKKRKKEIHANSKNYHIKKENPSPSPTPMDLTGMPSMDELLYKAPISKNKKKPSNPKNRNYIKNKAEMHHSALDLNDMPNMDQLLTVEQKERSSLSNQTTSIYPLSQNLSRKNSPKQGLVLDNMDEASMEEILATSDFEITKHETLSGTISTIHGDKVIVELDDGNQGIMDRLSHKARSSLRQGSRVLVSFDATTITSHSPKLTLVKVISRLKSAYTASKRKSSIQSLSNNRFVIDGSNVCRSYLNLEGSSSLKPLITLVHTLMRNNASCVCFFDASERYLLRGNIREGEGERTYERLLREFPGIFIEVQTGENADDSILELADRDGLSIISNDRFNKIEDRHLQLYPWLNVGNNRLIRGAVVNEILIVERLGLSIHLQNDLIEAVDSLRHLINLNP